MTVVVCVRTGASAVLAADSKLTTQAYVGKNPDGTPRFLSQTYDQAVKIVQDASETSVIAFAGFGNIGEQTATDYYARIAANLHVGPADQDNKVAQLAADMAQHRSAFAGKFGFAANQIPETIALLVAPPLGAVAPRVWRIALEGDKHSVQEVLETPGVWFEGNVTTVLSLLYGHLAPYTDAMRATLGIDPGALAQAQVAHADLLPIRQINFWTMPLQDAMDFAVFCAGVEIEMERFLPGEAVCGGPVDLMSLEMSPAPKIRAFPGKRLHHPEHVRRAGE